MYGIAWHVSAWCHVNRRAEDKQLINRAVDFASSETKLSLKLTNIQQISYNYEANINLHISNLVYKNQHCGLNLQLDTLIHFGS